MAEIKITVSTLSSKRSGNDTDIMRFIEGFLRDWCENNDKSYDSLTNQQKLDLFLKVTLDQVKDVSYSWFRRKAIKDATSNITIDPINF